MGAYTDNLTKRGRAPKPAPYTGERLVAAALVRDDVVESRGFKAHWQIRAALGDDMPSQSRPTDEEGFLTSEGRFVSRYEAAIIGEDAGQCHRSRAELLSSDINW